MISQQIVVENYTGEADPTNLIPHIGSSFEDVKELKETVELLKRWQFKSALEKLDANIASGTQLLDSLLLKGELLAALEYNDQATNSFETALQYEPNNVYALSMILILSSRNPHKKYAAKLYELSPQLHDKLQNVLNFVEENKTKTDFSEITEPLDLICVYGYVINEDGTIPDRLEKRLLKTLEVAQAHPEARVLLSGGAVQNKYCEAIEMKKYLVNAGVSDERLVPLVKAKDTVGNILEFMEHIDAENYSSICAVTSIDHLPRAWMALYIALQKNGYSGRLYGAAYEESINPIVFERELQLSSQTVLRAAGFYSKQGMESQLN